MKDEADEDCGFKEVDPWLLLRNRIHLRWVNQWQARTDKTAGGSLFIIECEDSPVLEPWPGDSTVACTNLQK